MDALPFPPDLDARSVMLVILYAAAALSCGWLGLDFLRRLKQPRSGAIRRFPFEGLSKWVVWGWLVLSVAGLLLRLPPAPIFWLATMAPLSVVSTLGEIAFARKMRAARQHQTALSNSLQAPSSPNEHRALWTP